MDLDYTLKKSEKNRVFVWLRQSGLEPAEFVWLESLSNEFDENGTSMGTYRISTLYHEETQYYFTFGRTEMEFSPSRRGRRQVKKHYDRDIDKESIFRQWLSALKPEVDAPDLWANINASKEFMEAMATSSTDNKPFDPSELSKIATSLEEIKTQIDESKEFTAEQIESVKVQLKEIGEASNRLGRKDWMNAALGYLVSEGIKSGWNKIQWNTASHWFGEAFKWLSDTASKLLN